MIFLLSSPFTQSLLAKAARILRLAPLGGAWRLHMVAARCETLRARDPLGYFSKLSSEIAGSAARRAVSRCFTSSVSHDQAAVPQQNVSA